MNLFHSHPLIAWLRVDLVINLDLRTPLGHWPMDDEDLDPGGFSSSVFSFSFGVVSIDCTLVVRPPAGKEEGFARMDERYSPGWVLCSLGFWARWRDIILREKSLL